MPEKKRLRILHVLLSRGFAGSERSTAESCNQQCLEHDVAVVVRKDHRKAGASVVDQLDSRVEVYEIHAFFFALWQLKSVLAKFKPDLIHTHLRRSTRLVAKAKPRAATCSTLHIEVNGPYFLHMDGLICNARWQVAKVPSEYGGMIHKASNSLQPHRRISKQQRQKLRSELGIEDSHYLIGAVGRYHTSKAWDTLIKAMKRVDCEQARLLFFGGGSLEGGLKGLASSDKRIQFIGFRPDIKDLYQCFDLFVCPSRYEPLPRVMLEAYDAGLPIIASDTGGCKELIDDYGGWSFSTDNVSELEACLQSCCDDRPSAERPDLSAHYVENANAAIVDFYCRLIDKKHAQY